MGNLSQFMLGNVKTLHGSSVEPSLAMCENSVVAVYRGSTGATSNLYYKAGTINNVGVLTWADQDDLHNDSGETPSVGLNSNHIVVEIHEAAGSSNKLWSHVGILDPYAKTINWGGGQDTGHSGYTPSVSVIYIQQQDIAIATYTSGSDANTVYFMIGRINYSNSTVGWTKLSGGTTGKNPKIAVNNEGKVILVADSETPNSDGTTSVHIKKGQLTNDLTNITWDEGSTVLSSSCMGFADVGMDQDGNLAFAYQGPGIFVDAITVGESLNYPIITRYGNLDAGRTLTLNPEAFGPGLGKKPSIAASIVDNTGVVAILQETPDEAGAVITSNDSKVFYASSMVQSIHSDRNKWMSHYQNRSLNQLCLPAAHDAGMSVVGYCTNLAGIYPTEDTQTQDLGFKDMLDNGIRYFDVRPAWFQNGSTTTTYTGHFSDQMGGVGCLGLKMKKDPTDTDDGVFDGVLNFLNENTGTEVVILKFSHYFLQVARSGHIDNANVFNYKDQSSIDTFKPLVKGLIEDVVNFFEDWLYVKPNDNRRLVDYPLGEITNRRSKVIAVFDFVELPTMNLNDMFSNSGVTDYDQINLNNKVLASIYSYADYFIDSSTVEQPVMSNCQLTVYDHYSNTDDIKVMVKSSAPSDDDHPGQRYLYLQPGNRSADLYLLSWTLTQSTSDIVVGTPSIRVLAAQANCCLGSYIQQLFQDGHITWTYLPNLVYTDFCDYYMTDICNFINAVLNRE